MTPNGLSGKSHESASQNAAIADLRAAFMAGFAASGEGWNGEYPWDGDMERIDNALDGAFSEWLPARFQKEADDGT